MNETLCWTCRVPGTGGCSWDLDFTPVAGWSATKTSVSTFPAGARTESYFVHDCPLYVPELYSRTGKRPGYGALLSDAQLEAYIFKGFSDWEIAQHCGMTEGSVRRRRKQFLLQQEELIDCDKHND